MWQYIISFGAGVYVGTYYDCKPSLNKIEEFFKNNFPTKK